VPSVGALAYDRARRQLYVGTAGAVGPAPTDVGTDRVLRYAIGVGADGAPTYTLQGQPFGRFTVVGGMGLRPNGRLLVLEDIAIITEGEPIGTGRMYQVGLPAARIAAGPFGLAGQRAKDGFTANPQPTFELQGDLDRQCWLRPASDPQPAEDWVACDGATFAPAAALADGAYLLTVRSTTGAGDLTDLTRWVPDTRRFTVDKDAPLQPSVTLVSPTTGTPPMTNAAPSFAFAANPADPAART
jgi:hypothetical protein